MPDNISNARFWSKDRSKWNFGDAISFFIYKNLLVDFIPYNTRPWTVGSVLFDGAALIEASEDNAKLPSFLGERECFGVFWGCGLRETDSLSAGAAERSAVLAVRGPLSASSLKLGTAAALGEPGLLLPAFYTPRTDARFAGRSVCIPHFDDARSDIEIIAASGCEVVLRPAILPSLHALERFIDAVSSADFVLCGALHGAISAAAYGTHFAYWDSGSVDIPFKWKDFSALVSIPCEFQANVQDGRNHYNNRVRPNLNLPSLWPLLCTAPTFLQPSGLMRVLHYELMRRQEEPEHVFTDLLQELDDSKPHFDHLAALSRDVTDKVIPSLVSDLERAQKNETQHLEELNQTRLKFNEIQEQVLIDASILRETLEKELEAARCEQEKLREENSRFVSEMSCLGQRVATLTDEQKSNSELVEVLQKELEITGEENAQLSQEISDLAKRASDLEERIAVLTDEKNSNSDLIEVLQKELDLAGKDNVRLSQEIPDFIEQISNLEERVVALTDNQNSSNEEMSALQRRINLAIHDDMAARAQTEAAQRRIAGLVKQIRRNRLYRQARKLPFIGKIDARLSRNTSKIMGFLDGFSDDQLGFSSEGREDRVISYLLGASSQVQDMPLLDRNLYHTLHPDVRGSGIDPFIHYLEFGQNEKRSPHPILDFGFYTHHYPETACFDQSILEHYIQFGAAKGYNPSELFDTRFYFSRYPDVKVSFYNPVLHYLRHPDCQPHPDFDSHSYRLKYPDTVRANCNPLSHFMLWGRGEGRSSNLHRYESAECFVSHEPSDRHTAPTAIQSDQSNFEEIRNRSPLVLMVDAFYPRPDQDSGSLDQVNFARIFRALGYEVAFCALLEFSCDKKITAALEGIGVNCITSQDYCNLEEFIFLNSERISSFFLSRFNFGGAWIEKARTFCPRAQIVFNTVDLHHVREERHARLLNDRAMLKNARITQRVELERIAAADITVVVSQTERELLNDLTPTADVRVIPLIREINDRSLPPFAARSGIAFIGGFEHQPNVDAVNTFLDSVWPKVLLEDPQLIFFVIGSNLPQSLSDRTDLNVQWVGYVPELEPWLDKVRVTVAPLRYGAGAKGKVVSSLLNGVPCVVSDVAAEGMSIEEGAGIISANDPTQFAAELLKLHRDEAFWDVTARRGLEAVRSAYSIEHGIELVQQFLPRINSEGARPW